MAPVIDVTRDALEARRAAILARLGMTEEEFCQARGSRSLTGEEWEAKEELEEISFLLGPSGE